jgi:hypothetical protein
MVIERMLRDLIARQLPPDLKLRTHSLLRSREPSELEDRLQDAPQSFEMLSLVLRIRPPERGIKRTGMAFFAWSSQAGGFFSGRYSKNEPDKPGTNDIARV